MIVFCNEGTCPIIILGFVSIFLVCIIFLGPQISYLPALPAIVRKSIIFYKISLLEMTKVFRKEVSSNLVKQKWTSDVGLTFLGCVAILVAAQPLNTVIVVVVVAAKSTFTTGLLT